jgi:hypothetical protein
MHEDRTEIRRQLGWKFQEAAMHNFEALPAAQRNYDRALPSDSERPNMDAEDRRQAKEAELWISYLRRAVMHDGVTMDIGYFRIDVARTTLDHIAGMMTTDQCVALGRAALKGDKDAVFEVAKAMTDAAIKTQAESIAERE